jgi:hypothetical protein
MNRRSDKATFRAHGRIPEFGDQVTQVKVGGPGWLTPHGPVGPHPISGSAADLLDIAAVVYRVERQLPKRGPSNPNLKYELTVPLREPDVWEGRPKALLQELLGFLGNAAWEVSFTSRRGGSLELSETKPSERPVTRVALLSGGLDSACGAGCGLISPLDTQLCSFYTRQKTLQRQIAADLGFSSPTQWQQKGIAGRGRSFYYRSFLFLSLATVTAQTWRARELVQFENGILASAIPPVPSIAMTKHAHPKFHRLFAELLESVLGGPWRIANPFWQMTEREAVEALERKLGAERAARTIGVTQSCWHLSAPHVFGVRELGSATKRVNEQCGVCVPCIIRRTAVPNERFAFDLRHNNVRNHPKLGAHFLEYLEFLSAVRDAATTADLRISLPAEALDLIDDGWSDLTLLDHLLRRFATEFFETFF